MSKAESASHHAEAIKSQIGLTPITSVKSSLEYSNQELSGAMKYPFLAQPALDRLNEATQILSYLCGMLTEPQKHRLLSLINT